MNELNNAGDFSFNISNVTDEEILNYLNQREYITIVSFVSPYTGIPHLCPVWGVFIGGKYYFQTDDHTYKVKFIKKGNNKLGISVTDPSLFPDYLEDSIPYLSLGGTATILTKKHFTDFEKILKLIFLKYIIDEEERTKVFKFVLNEMKSRVLIGITPEWVKVPRVPKKNS
ncbi:MAG: hypothetical protein ACFFCZ_17230 [Promethearchaeota archaeon]